MHKSLLVLAVALATSGLAHADTLKKIKDCLLYTSPSPRD